MVFSPLFSTIARFIPKRFTPTWHLDPTHRYDIHDAFPWKQNIEFRAFFSAKNRWWKRFFTMTLGRAQSSQSSQLTNHPNWRSHVLFRGLETEKSHCNPMEKRTIFFCTSGAPFSSLCPAFPALQRLAIHATRWCYRSLKLVYKS